MIEFNYNNLRLSDRLASFSFSFFFGGLGRGGGGDKIPVNDVCIYMMYTCIFYACH